MNKVRNIVLCVFLLLEATLLSAQAQTSGRGGVKATQTYDKVYRANSWNLSHNITGVRQDSVSRSYAELFGGYEAGEFRQTWQPKQSWNVGAITASITHLKNMTLAGSFSYHQQENDEMCGSMFIQPGFYPVDLLEFTPGRKTLQEYAFEGGISYDLAPQWRIGVNVDFTSTNLAKRKDLRHTNWRLDLAVKPGFMFHQGDFALGASYIYQRNSESVKAEQIGTAASSYYAFLDKGMMYGIYSVWGGSGLHLSEPGVNGFPIRENIHGAALQAQYAGLFGEISYQHKQGVIGEKDHIWFRYPADAWTLALAYSHREHFARLNMGLEGLRMSEVILESVTENGITTMREYGSTQILAQTRQYIAASYEYISEDWELLAEGEFVSQEKMSSQIYPYVYRQKLNTWDCLVKGTGHLWDFDVEAWVGASGGALSEKDSMLAHSMEVETQPYRLTSWHELAMEYACSPRLRVGVALRYHFWKGLYVQVDGLWQHGFELHHYSSAERYWVGLKLGYNF